jgi:fructose-specific phosphotransferase system IIC component
LWSFFISFICGVTIGTLMFCFMVAPAKGLSDGLDAIVWTLFVPPIPVFLIGLICGLLRNRSWYKTPYYNTYE